MKIHTRFFITFFCFALFFAFSSYLAQDSMFKHNQNREDARINQQLDYIRGNIEKDENSVIDYLNDNQIELRKVYFDKKDQVVKSVAISALNNDFSSYFTEEFKTEYDIQNACQTINATENKVSINTPINYESDYIVQEFCQNNNVYVMVSHYVQYGNAIRLLKQSYLFIFVATIVVSAILSYILARYISTPIQKISYVTRQISNLDFSNKVEVAGNDEIGELAVNINILSDKLQHSINKLKENVIVEKESRERQVQLFASMSHELKTPITILKGTLEGIKDQIGPYKNPLDHVDAMMEEVDNMENLVMNLLSYAKFSVSDMKLTLKPYHLQKLIYDTVNRLEYLFRENDIDLEIVVADAIVDIDVASMQMVLKNIIENAIRYSEKGAKIEIFASPFSDHVLVQVYNHGTNIDPERILHLFEPFYRADDSRVKYKNGTGLGLTIVKQILEQHNSTPNIYNINNDEEYAVCFEFVLAKSKDQEL